MKNKNQITADKLDNMNLSEKARNIIANTDYTILHELFGNCETAEQVEECINDYYIDEE